MIRKPRPKAYLDGTGPGWRALGEDDFTDVNCEPDTWTWKDGVIHCTGKPVRRDPHQERSRWHNFELVARVEAFTAGRKLRRSSCGAPEKALEGVKPEFAAPGAASKCRFSTTVTKEQYEKMSGKKARLVHDQRRRASRWAHSKMTPLPAAFSDGSRKLPDETS